MYKQCHKTNHNLMQLLVLVLKRLSFINFLVNFLPSYYQLLFQSNTWFLNQSFRRIVISHVSNSSRILLLGSRVYSGRHVSHNALVFSRSKGIKKRSATSFSQRLLVKLHRYCATIRGSKLPLYQVYFAVPLLPFGASRQPKYVLSFYLLSCELLVFSLSRKVSFSI